MIYTLNTVLHNIINALKNQYSYEEAQSIAWELIRHITQKSRIELLVQPKPLSAEQVKQLEYFLEEHLNKQVPIAYLTGEIVFGDLTLSIRPPILIPRSETEAWCYGLIELLEPCNTEHLRILDLCTGSGCIALALAHELPHTRVVGVDINPEAIALAEENKQKLAITNCSFIKSDLFEVLVNETFDIIVANPPYISINELPSLSPSVSNYESHQALFAHKEGYAVIEDIIKDARRYLRNNKKLVTYSIPQLLIEIGHTQGEPVKAFMEKQSYANIVLWKDYQGHNRVACAQVLQNDTNSEKS